MTSVIEKSLIGIVAKDYAVVTAAVCQPSTLKHNAGDTWTETCTVTESDGSVSTGFASLIPATDQITYDPQTLVSQP